MDRDFTLREIRHTAKENGGQPLVAWALSRELVEQLTLWRCELAVTTVELTERETGR